MWGRGRRYVHSGIYPRARCSRVELKRTAPVKPTLRCRGSPSRVGEALPGRQHVRRSLRAALELMHATTVLRAAEMVRVSRPWGHIASSCPTASTSSRRHGIYRKGKYRFGNSPFVNWLPMAGNGHAPRPAHHGRCGPGRPFHWLPVRTVQHTLIYPGYDNIVARRAQLKHALRRP